MGSRSRGERDEFRRKLKEEWKLVWTERFDDRLKAEGIAARDYPLLFTDRGFVLFASRATKIPSFSEIVKIWASRGNVYSPDPSNGGWGKFIRTELRNPQHSRARSFRANENRLNRKEGQMKKHGRGWLHA